MAQEYVRMDLAEYASYDGFALAQLVKEKKITPKELALLFLEAVEKINPKINAVIEVWSDRIERLDDLVVPGGPFAGVPFLMKDVGSGEGGRIQNSGSRLMKGHVVDKDS